MKVNLISPYRIGPIGKNNKYVKSKFFKLEFTFHLLIYGNFQD